MYTSERQQPPGSWEQLSIPSGPGPAEPAEEPGARLTLCQPWGGGGLSSQDGHRAGNTASEQRRGAEEPGAPQGEVFGGLLGGDGFAWPLSVTVTLHHCKSILRVFSRHQRCSW